jgi:hypothetical protein
MLRTPLRALTLVAIALAVFALFRQDFAQAPAPALAHGTETFTDVLPAKVYSGVPSHTGLATADPTFGVVGYCVRVANDDHRSLGGDRGFSVANGAILSTDYFDNGSAVTTDDIYCAVVQADRVVDDLPRPDMVLTWTYLDSGLAVNVTLAVQVVTVELIGTNGVILGVTTICTRGWDPVFLTGRDANNPPATTNPIDLVIAADWTTFPASPPDILGVARNGDEWCLNITANAAIADIDVSLRFWALYSPDTAADDILITETAPDVVDIEFPEKPELRHITVDGQLDQRQLANPQVIGSSHIACAIPSVLQDSATPAQVQITSPNGAIAVGISVFHATGATVPGVPSGTLCIRWTSFAPGEQRIAMNMTVSVANPTNTSGSPQNQFVNWDTNGDGNDVGVVGGPLIMHWDVIDHTRITRSGSSFDSDLNGGSITLPSSLILTAGGGGLEAEVTIYDWAMGRRPDPNGATAEPIDGVPITATVFSGCAYFGDGPAGPTTVQATTTGGRIGVKVKIDGAGCSPGSQIVIRFQASYPQAISSPLPVPVESVTITVSFTVPDSAPRVAWVGSRVAVPFPYAFSGDCDGVQVLYSRASTQKGTFIGGSHRLLVTLVTDACDPLVFYESEDQGEVDLIVEVVGFPLSKVHQPVFYMAFEDLRLSVDESETTVSNLNKHTGTVRGWFVGTNPSGRPAETKHGHDLPANRWVIPDDWQRLKGPDDFRGAWPSAPSMPPTRMTFFMENEPRRNSYKLGIKDGASGMFVDDDGAAFAFNVHPDTLAPSVLGRPDKPRIISELSDSDGEADVNVFGDLNLTYEDCPKDIVTGSPACRPGDIAGHSYVYVAVEYADATTRGKWWNLRTDAREVPLRWAGYKRLTVEDGETPNSRYVVVHMKDRDGFCDALSFNNTHGLQVQFQIDSADGIITAGAGQPAVISQSRKFAIVTAFDTHDDFGVAVNTDITKTLIETDECQAWVKIENSLRTDVNIIVTIAGMPGAIHGQFRITELVCGDGGYAVITNVGQVESSLNGFALRSLGGDSSHPEAHVGLRGSLKPGQGIVIPGFVFYSWLFSGDDENFGNEPGDYARLAWEDTTTVHARFCDGREVNVSPTPTFLPDDEGQIQFDEVLSFNEFQPLRVAPGWNLVSIGGDGIDVTTAIGPNESEVAAIYSYDPATGTWSRFIPGVPGGNSLNRLDGGKTYWVLAKRGFTMTVPR